MLLRPLVPTHRTNNLLRPFVPAHRTDLLASIISTGSKSVSTSFEKGDSDFFKKTSYASVCDTKVFSSFKVQKNFQQCVCNNSPPLMRAPRWWRCAPDARTAQGPPVASNCIERILKKPIVCSRHSCQRCALKSHGLAMVILAHAPLSLFSLEDRKLQISGVLELQLVLPCCRLTVRTRNHG